MQNVIKGILVYNKLERTCRKRRNQQIFILDCLEKESGLFYKCLLVKGNNVKSSFAIDLHARRFWTNNG